MSELQEATKEFLIESHENLDQLDTDLVGLESSAAPAEALGRIFRTLHTIKGSCSFLGFPRLEAVAHAGENVLGRLRDGNLPLTPAVMGTLLRMVDAIRRILAAVENSESDDVGGYEQLVEELNGLAVGAAPGRTLAVSDGAMHRLDSPSQLDFALGDGVEMLPASADSVPAADASAVADSSVRINVELLDRLMSVAGEIVLARNQILQYAQRHPDPSFQNTCRQLNLITTELQEHVMKTRLQPLGNVWNRFPRLVRDSARACGKKVRLETAGSETELDKTLLEAVRDPLTHLVRNAIDHGIEAPERRRAAGKPEEGSVRLNAYHEGGQVNIEISDDGGGIDPDRVKHRAVEQRLVTPEQADRMTAETVLGLIFRPGFSTAAAVTTVSGRGVGMDVVKTNIEKIGGSVDVHSTAGRGTTVRLRIPLTLAIIKVLVVTAAGDRYAVPQVSIVELVRIEPEKARAVIQRVQGVWVYRYRGRLLPLVNLADVLKVASREPTDGAINIVVLQAAGGQFGLIVEHIHDTQEIVVKPLWKHLKSLACFAGATVMGDGHVALILDVFGLAQRSGAVSDASGPAVAGPEPVAPQRAERPSVLLVEGPGRARMAIGLGKVARLEEFPATALERVADRQVVQYGGRILPLVHVNGRSGPANSDGGRDLQVVVCGAGERAVGLIVERILDIVEQDSDSRVPPSRPGVEYAAIIQGHVTEVLDVEGLVRSAVGGEA